MLKQKPSARAQCIGRQANDLLKRFKPCCPTTSAVRGSAEGRLRKVCISLGDVGRVRHHKISVHP